MGSECWQAAGIGTASGSWLGQDRDLAERRSVHTFAPGV